MPILLKLLLILTISIIAKSAIKRASLLRDLFLVRAGDLREERLLRQGRGWIHIPGQGHEALAALATSLEPDDLLFLYYRDRALMQARGVTPLEMAREHLATAHSSSGGRQMPVHGSFRRLGIYPPATPTASQCLPALGAAWGIKHLGMNRVVLCTIGDASTRQGEFFEAVVQAVQDRLPIVFVVEDNGYGISTPTLDQLPFRLGIFDPSIFRHVDGRSVEMVADAGSDAIAAARRGDGPMVLWVELDRLTSHTNSDDHRIYRTTAEIAAMQARDPVTRYAASLVERGMLDATQVEALQSEATAEADAAYAAAEIEPAPMASSANTKLFGPFERDGYLPPFTLEDAANTMAGALNATLREALARIPNTIIFGEDVEDPKGGVFGFTKGLSTRFPGRVVNSPLAEATIAGMGVGLAATGFRPILEMQFIDFIAPAFNQLLNQAATLRWRSNGDWTCPAVFYAPYGAYLPAGSTWHSQSNEGIWTHIPGLRVAVPSTPSDLMGLLWSALQESDPTLLLVPKHIMRVRHDPLPPQARGFGRARTVQSGTDVTLVTWGNCLEIAQKAAAHHADRWSIEIIDLISLVPCDWAAIDASVAKTGRLVVVTEDARTGSFGQAIITEAVGSQARFNRFLSPPLLVAREDGHIPFNPVLEYAVLPDAARVHAALAEVMQ
ncbi:MAG TPA: thiamine pyrophosphate-dependent enzyme [Casimicrobiaceae bacterium]|nr:thiamine pyrophosphate-dependent enzyme [Casimicrobiaceae bacterium]